jgi:chitinase
MVHAAGAEIYPSIGGWSLSDAFVAMAASTAGRQNFANNCVDLIEEYEFDGIDIDW